MRCLRCGKMTCVRCEREAEKRKESQYELRVALQKCREEPPSSSTGFVELSYSWREHPERPHPFCVIDQQKIPEEEKLAWVRQELGDGADLQVFAQKWLDLFGEKLRGAVPQKAACLKLYGQYAPEGAEACAWKKECDIPPQERQAFEQLWGDTREICFECGKATAPGLKHSVRRKGRAFCSTQCATAGTVLSCRKCDQPVSVEQPRCATCQWGCHQNILLPRAAASRQAGWTIYSRRTRRA